MKVPKCCEVSVTCIKCNCTINHTKDFEDSAVNVGVWDGASVTTIFSSFNSELSGCAYIIGICDSCLKNAALKGEAVEFYNRYKFDTPDVNEEQSRQWIEMDLEFEPKIGDLPIE